MAQRSVKFPAWQFYVGDWRKDPGVQSLEYEERGVLFEILLIMFESQPRGYLTLNGKPMPSKALANLLGIGEAKCKQIVDTILDYGVLSVVEESGILFNRRMVRDEEIRQQRAAAGEKGGKSRGKVQQDKQTPQQTASKPQAKEEANPKQKGPPSVSVSSSVSSSDHSTGLSDDHVPRSFAEWRTALVDEGFTMKSMGSPKVVTMVNTWVDAGVSVGLMREALQVADAKLGQTPDTPGYLGWIVADMIKPDHPGQAPAAPKPKPWHESWSGIVAKGAELGLDESQFRDQQSFKYAVFDKAGLRDKIPDAFKRSGMKAGHTVVNNVIQGMNTQ